MGTEITCQKSEFQVDLYGKNFFGATNSHIDWHVFFFGEYDPLGISLLTQIATTIPNCVFLDVGSNTGTHMLAMSNVCDKIHCFEPYPRILTSLKRHVSANQLSNVTVHEFGLSTDNIVAKYFENVYSNFGAGSFEAQHENVETTSNMELPLRNGDQALTEIGFDKIDIVKIDVEGHEPSVLAGMADHMKKMRPIVFWEFGPTTRIYIKDISDLRSRFPENYTFLYLTYTNRWTRSTPALRPYQFPETGNILAVPNEKELSVAGLKQTS